MPRIVATNVVFHLDTLGEYQAALATALANASFANVVGDEVALTITCDIDGE